MPDAQVYSCNLEWFNSLPADIQAGIEMASEVTSHQNLSKVPSARAYAMAEMRKSGVEFYSLTPDELAQWVAKGGHQNPEWNSYKKDLAGSMSNFGKLLDAANTQGRYYVNDA
ncbi:MAG: TRAP-type C4-dicarboxylate transport system substrate-binding protein [Cellvibrionaceae bacterium]